MSKSWKTKELILDNWVEDTLKAEILPSMNDDEILVIYINTSGTSIVREKELIELVKFLKSEGIKFVAIPVDSSNGIQNMNLKVDKIDEVIEYLQKLKRDIINKNNITW